MKQKLFLASGLAVAGLVLTVGVAFAAITPTFGLSGVGTDSVVITVVGDPNSSAVLFYNVGASTGAKVAILGTTDATGALTKTVSVAALDLNSSNAVYVVVNSQQSITVQWVNSAAATTSGSTSAATTSGGLTFSQTNPTIQVGQSATINITGATSFYVSSNSTAGITTNILNGTTLTVTGVANGSTVVGVCSADSTKCGSVSVTVGTSSGTTTAGTSSGLVAFSQTNPTLTVGLVVNITLSNATTFYVSSNSNQSAVQTSITGNVLTLTGLAAGSANVMVCGNTAGCNTMYPTVTGAGSVVTPTTPAVTTPAPTTSVGTALSTLTTIQTMQVQLEQMLTAIKAMQAQLAQIVANMASGLTTAPVTPSASASVSFSGTFTSLLKLNSTGPEVTALQQRLIKEGYLSASATGFFGPATEAALKKFQTANGIDPAGYTGPSTRSALNSQ